MTRRTVALACVTLLASWLMLGLQSSPARAATTCLFDPLFLPPAGQTMLLLNDCTTDTAILVPDGVTLDGNGHTITAVEPGTGSFTGAVVQNATPGSVIHVTNLKITAQLAANPCDAGEARLRGILFFGASGTATNNVVFGLNQGVNFGCQEGNAIEARNFVGETQSSVSRTSVTISDNVARDYQKTGILISGNVDAIVTRNIVEGIGPTDVIAQNGIQIGFGATGLISANQISGNDYTPNPVFACGILIADADGVDRKQQDNLFTGNEKDTCGFSKGGNYEPFGN
jgi:hypothetical protein